MAFNKIPTENDVTDLDEDFFDDLQDNIETAFDDSVNGTVLYENNSGATESFELDVDSTGYKIADVYVGRNTGTVVGRIIRVLLNSNYFIPLDFIDNDGSVSILYHARIKIDGTQVTVSGNSNSIQITGSGTVGTSANKLAIYKIVGFK